MNNIYSQFLYLFALSISSVIALICLLNKRQKAITFLCVYIIYGLVSECSSIISAKYFGNNYLISNLYDYLSLFLLSSYFIFSIGKAKIKHYIALLLFTAFSIIFENGFFQNHFHISEYISGLILIIITLYIIYKLALKDDEKSIWNHSNFWVAILVLSNHYIALWCKSNTYAQKNLSIEDIEYIQITLYFSNSIYYLSLGIILIIFPCKNLKNELL